MENLVVELQKIGFSQYESKAYIALLKHSPVTGYEVSKRSGVPRSMIYEVLGKLIDRGAVYIVPSDPVKYSPVPAKEMVCRIRESMEHTFSYLEDRLNTIEQAPELNVILHISGEDAVMKEMLDVIGRAEKELWISVWEPQVEQVKTAVDNIRNPDLSIFSIIFGAEEQKIGHSFHHNYMPPQVVQERIGGCLTIVARDGEEVVIANFHDKNEPSAVKTKDPALVLVAIEYIRHDIMIEEITREYGPEKVNALWRSRSDLFQIVTGRNFTKV
ncbi:TrmB family transcriptional regulator [Bacillus salitolerans]|uniref:TrmB family transcriptional regulator n=1 Tax=Bacillus salitolerans TaxID=1437434 RepID=A0ABW4LXB9_9BACI